MKGEGRSGTRRLWLVVLALPALLFSGHALARDDEPRHDEAPPVRSQTVAVFGDSLADGLWIGLRRALRGDARAGDVLQFSEVSTGLANYVYRDIAEKTRDQLAGTHVDIAVVMFGSNDIQGIRDGSDVHRFRSRGWEDVYRSRIRELIGLLTGQGAQVYWVGLPVMRSASYNANTIYLNSIFEEEAAAAGIAFIPTRSVSADADGAYSAYLPDRAGTPRLVRADDGIHFTLPGYLRIAAPVATALREGLDAPAPVMMAETGDAAAQTAAAPGLLGELLELTLNGQAYICQPVAPARSAAAGRAGANGAQP